MNTILYQKEDYLSPEEFTSLLVRSTLGERRPIDDPERMTMMCKNANLIITARMEGKLIGIARSLTDFAFCTYLSELAVDQDYQKQGIGKRLIVETKKHVPLTTLTLLAAPAAINYYPKIGMDQYEFCYRLRNVENIKL